MKVVRCVIAVAGAFILAGCLPAAQPEAKSATENATSTIAAVSVRSWPVINDFSAGSSNILPGENVTLRWNVSDAAVVTIDNGPGRVQPAGSVDVAPQSTTRYTLTASGEKGMSNAWVTVEVADRSTFLPDLVITGVTHISGLLYYKIKNTGAVDAGPSETYVYDQSNILRDTSWVDGLKAGEEKTLPFTNYDWGGYKITVCSDGKKQVSEASEDNNCYVPTFGFKYNYDFGQYASRARWRGSAGWVKYFDGDRVAGLAVRLPEVVAGDNQTYRNVIEMVPPNSGYGWIEGYFGDWQEQWQSGGYMLPLELPYNVRFTARVGLSGEARGEGGVTFLFGIQDERGAIHWWPAVKASYDGKLTDLDIDLSAYGGKKVMAVLRVEAGADSDRNYALWIEPRISQ
jgi:hypothetical protein